MSRTLPQAVLTVLAALTWAAAGPSAWAAAGPSAWAAAGPSAWAARAPSWSWPVVGVVSRPFAPPEQRWGAGHRGVDLLSAPGAPVRAAGAGRVSYAGLLAGRGVLVVVHGALRTTYEPVSAAVVVGALVGQGQVIGTLEAGHLGCPAAACLHWGLRRGEDYLDPLRLVEPRPVRLLPTGGAPAAAVGSAGVAADASRRAVLPAAPTDGALPRKDAAARTGPAGPPSGAADTGGAAAGRARSPTDGAGASQAAALTVLGAGGVLAAAALRRRS